jgi:hypothetical protein
LARPRQKTVRLKEFFERPEHADVWTEFDADEWITVIAYGSLPRPLVDEDRALRDELLGVERIADEGERRATVERIAKAQADLKVRQRRLMLVDWNVKRPSDGKPFKKPSEGYDPFADPAMDVNLENSVVHAMMFAFDRVDEGKRLGEGSGSETPSEVLVDTPT